jgi:hypothetical protein
MGLEARKVIKPMTTNLQYNVEKRFHKRRGQLRAISKWLQDVKDGHDGLSLKSYCEAEEVDSRGITKLMKEPKIQDMIDKVTIEMARVGSKMTTSLLLQRVAKEGKSMDTQEVVRVGEHLQKIRHGAFSRGHDAGGNQVLVNINLPEGGYEEPVRVEAIEKASEVLDGLV